jgi:hypothetical protein
MDREERKRRKEVLGRKGNEAQLLKYFNCIETKSCIL